MTTLVVDRNTARRVLTLVDAGLCRGMGQQVPGQMCVEAAVCNAMGLPHSDNPPCVEPAVRRFKISLNDSAWSSPEARGKGLRRIAVAQLGSKDIVNGVEFSLKLSERTIRVMVPLALRAAMGLLSNVPNMGTHVEALTNVALRCEKEGTQEAADAAWSAADAAGSAAYAAGYAAAAAGSAAVAAGSAADAARRAAAAARRAASAAGYAASAAGSAADAAGSAASATWRAADAAWNAASAAGNAAYAAGYAASAAGNAAYAAGYAADAAWYAAVDQILTTSSELAIDVLRDLKSPGIEWMDELCPLQDPPSTPDVAVTDQAVS